MEEKTILDITQIQAILPHRYPFLMVDKIVDLKDNEYIVGIKNVSVNESFFQGHFPGRPIMPGVLILEAMAQTSAILAKKSTQGIAAEKMIYLVGADEMKWRKQVVPGDQIRIRMDFHKKKRPLWVMKGSVSVGDDVVASGFISAVEAD